jgi:hypothetical protein
MRGRSAENIDATFTRTKEQKESRHLSNHSSARLRPAVAVELDTTRILASF